MICFTEVLFLAKSDTVVALIKFLTTGERLSFSTHYFYKKLNAPDRTHVVLKCTANLRGFVCPRMCGVRSGNDTKAFLALPRDVGSFVRP